MSWYIVLIDGLAGSRRGLLRLPAFPCLYSSPCHIKTEPLHLESTFLYNGFSLCKIPNLIQQTFNLVVLIIPHFRTADR